MTLKINEEVAQALAEGSPVVAMESTLITHGLPYPSNIEVAQRMETAVKHSGATPATTAIINGDVCVGLPADELEWLGTQPKETLYRSSSRNLAWAIAHKSSGATTVSGTMAIAKASGISVMTTGGIGGVHRGNAFDVSSDLTELARNPVAVVCSGVKPFLDIQATKEVLETNGVLLLGLGTHDFAPFFTTESGVDVDYCAGSVDEVSATILANKMLGRASGVVVTVPVPDEYRFDYNRLEPAFSEAVRELEKQNIHGGEVTTFMVRYLVEKLGGASVLGNIELLINNAEEASKIARSLADKQ